jgi:hypothetical protein
MRRVVVFLGAISCLGAACFSYGCASDADRPKEEKTADDVPGAYIVRGISGFARDEQPTTDERKQHLEIVDALIVSIERAHPGRLGQIEADMMSADAERVHRGKELLTATIAEAGAPKETEGSLVAAQSFGDQLVDAGQQLADGGVQLLCEQPKGADGRPLRLGNVGGTFGDDRTGGSGAAADALDLAGPSPASRQLNLSRIDAGMMTPNPESRLGAYAATRGYPSGTVGASVHAAIGTIYTLMGNYGEERIGRVFNSPEARALYGQPVASCAGMQMAMLEHQYWQDVRNEDSWSAGGRLGSAFNPTSRDLLQRRLFSLLPAR